MPSSKHKKGGNEGKNAREPLPKRPSNFLRTAQDKAIAIKMEEGRRLGDQPVHSTKCSLGGPFPPWVRLARAPDWKFGHFP